MTLAERAGVGPAGDLAQRMRYVSAGMTFVGAANAKKHSLRLSAHFCGASVARQQPRMRAKPNNQEQ